MVWSFERQKSVMKFLNGRTFMRHGMVLNEM